MRFKSTLFLVFLLNAGIHTGANAQFVNNGSNIIIQNGASINVVGDFNNISGSITNLGNINVSGNWANADAQGVFTLPSSGLVTLNGANQNIGGTQKTVFPNLTLAGTGIKKLLVNTDVRANLDLADRELALEDKNFEVLGTTQTSLIFTTGFISTNLKGFLYRNTSSGATYTYPLGSNLSGSFKYRPVTVLTKDNLNNSIGLSFVEKDPSNEGFSRDAKRFDVNEVNPLFFYLLDQKTGTSLADFNFFYNNPLDGNFNQLVNWVKFNLWEKAGISNQQPVLGNPQYNQVMTYSTLQPVSLLSITMSSITPNNDPITIFNSFSPDGDGKNDKWEIKNIDLFPNNELTILNRYGSEILKVNGYNNANAWDGGSLNNGTYFYLLKVNINKEQKVYKGFITLLRND
ncbi:gliding motility-associated C-terminal domain-containing protein [Pedobacter alpinus]|uniref:Gliding motility-associated C-terminal domain-containing protein n=1 Tax=Pedobacter alpinus TaxID=1590643 RepID=A0ABW5TLR7_9SPHI